MGGKKAKSKKKSKKKKNGLVGYREEEEGANDQIKCMGQNAGSFLLTGASGLKEFLLVLISSHKLSKSTNQCSI